MMHEAVDKGIQIEGHILNELYSGHSSYPINIKMKGDKKKKQVIIYLARTQHLY